jgi:hypothetical protein
MSENVFVIGGPSVYLPVYFTFFVDSHFQVLHTATENTTRLCSVITFSTFFSPQPIFCIYTRSPKQRISELGQVVWYDPATIFLLHLYFKMCEVLDWIYLVLDTEQLPYFVCTLMKLRGPQNVNNVWPAQRIPSS